MIKPSGLEPCRVNSRRFTHWASSGKPTANQRLNDPREETHCSERGYRGSTVSHYLKERGTEFVPTEAIRLQEMSAISLNKREKNLMYKCGYLLLVARKSFTCYYTLKKLPVIVGETSRINSKVISF